jgi:hypothetical protein
MIMKIYHQEMQKKYFILALTLLLALTAALAACGPSATEAVGARTVTYRVTFINSIPTKTPYQTWTIDQTRAANRILEQTLAALNTTTQSAYKTVIISFPGSCEDSGYSEYLTLFSPDGNWLAIDCPSQEKFVVVSKNGGQNWSIPYEDAFKGAYPDHVVFCKIK